MKLLLFLIATAAWPVNDYNVKFINCYDGDTCTFDVTISDFTHYAGLGVSERNILTKESQNVRLCDINAPELKPGPNPAAIKARDDLIDWIKNANDLILEVPMKPSCRVPEHSEDSCDQYEKYGRLLGYIIADGVNLNQKQLDSNNAVPFIQCQ